MQRKGNKEKDKKVSKIAYEETKPRMVQKEMCCAGKD